MLSSRYMEMFLNFLQSSILKWDIKNFLAVVNKGGCESISSLGVECFALPVVAEDGEFQGQSEKAFYRTVTVKGQLQLAILQLGYSVVITDGDIVYLQNPMPKLAAEADKYDALVQYDSEGHLCSGFMHFRPTPLGLLWTRKAVEYEQTEGLMDQPATEKGLEWVELKHPELAYKVGPPRHWAVCIGLWATLIASYSHVSDCTQHLDAKEFPTGRLYFETPYRRQFYGDWPEPATVIVHNNYIVGVEAKAYRFKEHLMWALDTDGYYSSPDGACWAPLTGVVTPKLVTSRRHAAQRGTFKLACPSPYLRQRKTKP